MKNKTTEEENIKKSFLDSTTIISDDTIQINKDYDRALDIITIKKLVDKVDQFDNNFFFVQDKPFGQKDIGCKDPHILTDIKYLTDPGITFDITQTFPLHKFDPYVELFFDNFKEFVEERHEKPDLFYNNYEIENTVKKLNEIIDRIKTDKDSQKFKDTLNNYNRIVDKNTESLLKYIAYLYTVNSRLLVVRVDFRYDLENKAGAFLTEEQIYEKYLQARKDRETFFKTFKKEFKNIVGYVWKLEYSLRTGFHYHFLFFFDGSENREDVTLAKLLGEFWKHTITEGRGLYFNCNAKKNEYRTLGIGTINYFDRDLLIGLRVAAEYLTKPDYIVRMILPKHGRTFGKGEMLSTPKSNKGRPREHEDFTWVLTSDSFKP